MKILLFCPTYTKENGELALYKDTKKSIQNLIIPDGIVLDIHISNNNPYSLTDNRKTNHENTLFQYRFGRQYALNHNYDAMFRAVV